MKRVVFECRQVRKDLLRQDELDAVSRSRLDLHLRRCEPCRQVAEDLTRLEAARPFVEEISEDRKREIYNHLVPVVHEITNRPERPGVVELFARPRTALVAVGSLAAALLIVFAVTRLVPQEGALATGTEKVGPWDGEPSIAHLGLVARHEGKVSVDGRDVRDSGRFRLAKGSRIQVAEDARFSFRAGDLARIALGGDTDWELTSSTETFVAIQLNRGRLAIEFDGTQGRVLEVTTPESLVRVKGTIFTVETFASGETRVGVLEGLVEILPLQGEPRTVSLEAGSLVSVPGTGELSMLTDDQRSLAAELRSMDEYPEEFTRMVRFDGSPERVKVEVNDRVLGTTPLNVRLPAGPFTYRLTSPGMEPVIGTVVDRAEQKEIRFSLLPSDDYEEIDMDFAAAEPSRPGKKAGRASRRKTGSRAWGLFKRARAAMTAGDIPYAIGLLERAVEGANGGRLTNGLSLLAECYAAAGMYAKAADCYDRLAEQSPATASAQNARYEVGRLSMDQLGDLSRARAAFTAYVASPSGGGLREEAYFSLCELDGREGAHRDALHCFNQFLRAFPGGHLGPDARLWRGALYQDLERRWADAERDLLAFVRARPRHPRADEARYRVAIGRYQVGDRRGALRVIKEYLHAHPKGRYRLRVERLRRAVLDPNFAWSPDSQ